MIIETIVVEAEIQPSPFFIFPSHKQKLFKRRKSPKRWRFTTIISLKTSLSIISPTKTDLLRRLRSSSNISTTLRLQIGSTRRFYAPTTTTTSSTSTPPPQPPPILLPPPLLISGYPVPLPSSSVPKTTTAPAPPLSSTKEEQRR